MSRDSRKGGKLAPFGRVDEFHSEEEIGGNILEKELAVRRRD